MSETFLLFGPGHGFLGEVCAQQGRMERVMLTAEGERRLGAHVGDWQMRGVPALRHVTLPVNNSAPAFFQERIQIRQDGFLEAVRRWMEGHGMALVDVGMEALACWQRILRLPLEPRERFIVIVALRGAEGQEIGEWERALRRAEDMVAAEERSLTEALRALRQKAAKELAAAFKVKKTTG